MFKQIARKQHTGDGEIQLLPRQLKDYLFRVRFLVIYFKVTIQNDNVGAQTLESEKFFHNSKLNVFFRDGKPMIRSVPFRVLEWFNQTVRRGYPDALVETADKSITAVSSATQDVEFFLEVPFALPFAANPADFEQSLALIGPIIPNIGGTGNADLTVQNVEVKIVAHGRRDKSFFAGIRQLLSVHGGQAPLTAEELPLGGRRLVNLLAYTKDNSTSPLAATKPTATVDESHVVLKANDVDVVDLAKYVGQRGEAAAFPARSTLTQTKVAPIIVPPDRWPMGDLPQGNTLKLEYDTNAGTAGDHHYLMHQLQSKSDACRMIYPGAERLGVEGIKDRVDIKKLSAGDIVPPELANWLPEGLRVREALGACGGSPSGE